MLFFSYHVLCFLYFQIICPLDYLVMLFQTLLFSNAYTDLLPPLSLPVQLPDQSVSNTVHAFHHQMHHTLLLYFFANIAYLITDPKLQFVENFT